MKSFNIYSDLKELKSEAPSIIDLKEGNIFSFYGIDPKKLYLNIGDWKNIGGIIIKRTK